MMATHTVATDLVIDNLGNVGKLSIVKGRDVRAGSGLHAFVKALSFAQKKPRALVEGTAGIAVAMGLAPLAEAVGEFSLPVALGDTPKSISYGDEEIALGAGYSAEAHRVGRGGVAIAVSTGCDGVVVCGGEGCELVIVYQYSMFTAKVGVNGIRANVPYTVNWGTGEWIEEQAPFSEEHPASQLTGSCTS